MPRPVTFAMRAASGYCGGGAYIARALDSLETMTSCAVAALGTPEMIVIAKATSANLRNMTKEKMRTVEFCVLACIADCVCFIVPQPTKRAAHL
jgi:hypothetical protein